MQQRNNTGAMLMRWRSGALAAMLVLVSGAHLIYAQTAAPVAPVPAPASIPAPVPAAPVAAAPSGQSIPKSLFISAQDRQRIKDALADYQNFLTAKTVEPFQTPSQPKPEEAPKKEVPKFFTYPQFFLESLVYHAPDDWFVRVNGQKISPQMSPDQSALAVIAIDNDRVLFRWKPVEMARVIDRWSKVAPAPDFSQPDTNAPMNVDYNADGTGKVPSLPVRVDKERKLVTFSLHSNQTFSSYAMKVLEGKVLPVTVENVTGADLEKKSAQTAPVPPPSDTTPADDSNSGLNGLMKTIDKQQQGKAP